MGAPDILRGLRASGFTVEVLDGGIVVRPSSGLTDEHRATIRALRPELYALLSGEQGSASSDRPCALSIDQAHRAHARPWNDAAIGRFNARVSRFRGFGWCEQDAEDLAEHAHLADIERDDRRPCLSCARLKGYAGNLRCGSPSAAGLHGDRAAIGTDLAAMPQRCPGFADAEVTP